MGGWAWKRPEESNNKAMHNNSRLEHEKAAEKKEKWLFEGIIIVHRNTKYS